MGKCVIPETRDKAGKCKNLTERHFPICRSLLYLAVFPHLKYNNSHKHVEMKDKFYLPPEEIIGINTLGTIIGTHLMETKRFTTYVSLS